MADEALPISNSPVPAAEPPAPTAEEGAAATTSGGVEVPAGLDGGGRGVEQQKDTNNNDAAAAAVPTTTDHASPPTPVPETVPSEEGGDAPAPPNLLPAVAAVAAPASPALSASKKTSGVGVVGGGKPPPAAPSALLDEANEELAFLLTSGKIDQSEVIALQKIVRENVALKEKITKLKSLLGRSAKAQREAKAELDVARVRLDESHREVSRLNARVENLASRPTHMDLLADFETNFDKALLSIGGKQGGGQTSGQDPSSSPTKESASAAAAAGASGSSKDDDAISPSDADYLYASEAAAAAAAGGGSVESSLLLTELSESKTRIDKLEGLNAALLHRASKLERTNESLSDERDAAVSKMTNLQLELRMAKMEADHAQRSARERESSLAEMQLEIDLVTKSAMDANVRAAEGMEAARTVQTDRQHVAELEAKVVALQEWALAAAEAKRVVSERAAILESKLRDLTEKDDEGVDANLGLGGGSGSGMERRLWSQTSSLVVGAGLVGTRVHVLGDATIQPNESVVLRWKFDLTPADTDILFSLLKGRYEDSTRPSQLKGADAIVRDRVVTGGGAGEATGAFAVKNSCTLVWSNERSWVRPKTVKYTVEAYAVM